MPVRPSIILFAAVPTLTHPKVQYCIPQCGIMSRPRYRKRWGTRSCAPAVVPSGSVHILDTFSSSQPETNTTLPVARLSSKALTQQYITKGQRPHDTGSVCYLGKHHRSANFQTFSSDASTHAMTERELPVYQSDGGIPHKSTSRVW